MGETSELKEVIQAMRKIAHCPVCRQILRPEMVTCINGHVICRECRGDQKVCPSCGKDFSKEMQCLTLVQQMVEAIPSLCRFTPCKKILKAGQDHEEHCVFQTTRCKKPNCAWEGPWADKGEHCFKAHFGLRGFFAAVYNIGGLIFKTDTSRIGKFDLTRSNVLFHKENFTLLVIEMVYDPKKDTTFTIYPIRRDLIESTFKCLISLEAASKLWEVIFKKTVKFDDTRDKDMTISSQMFKKFMENDDFKMKIEVERVD